MARGCGDGAFQDRGLTGRGTALAPSLVTDPACEEDLQDVNRGGSSGLGSARAPREASRAAERGPPWEEQGGSGHVWLGGREAWIWISTVAGGERSFFVACEQGARDEILERR